MQYLPSNHKPTWDNSTQRIPEKARINDFIARPTQKVGQPKCVNHISRITLYVTIVFSHFFLGSYADINYSK